MMKKYWLVLLTLVPVLAGYFINVLILVPVAGMLLFYLLPLCILVFWFWLGGQYAKTNWNAAVSILIGNMTGLLSLALYFWQFLGESSETRNLTLAGLSQMYSAAAPGYLVGRLAVLFEGRQVFVVMQVLSVALMAAVFTAGYLRKRRAGKRG